MAYLIPAEARVTEITIVNSRFITAAARADSVDSARRFIATRRAALPDASHHVYAYRIGYGGSVIEGMSDDGEPSGTSGPPTLAVLRGSPIGDVVLATTRYFGGTKLGTGGLVRAYTEAAQKALAHLPTILKEPKLLLGIDLPYALYESVARLIAQHEGLIHNEDFGGQVTLFVLVRRANFEALSADLRTLSAGRITPVVLEEHDI